MDRAEAEKLLPCPLCGDADRPKVRPFASGYVVTCDAAGWDGAQGSGCGCESGWAATEAKAIAAWNRRAPDPAIRAAREEVLAKCVSFLDYGVERAHRDWRDPRQAEAVAEVCAEIAGAMRALPLDPEPTP